MDEEKVFWKSKMGRKASRSSKKQVMVTAQTEEDISEESEEDPDEDLFALNKTLLANQST